MESEYQKLSIMVVDGDVIDQRNLIRLLKDAPWNVFSVINGKEAINKLGNETPNCVLLDFNIPGTETWSLLDYFVHRNLPVIVLSGQVNAKLSTSTKTAGAFACLDKQRLTSERLAETIRYATLAQQPHN